MTILKLAPSPPADNVFLLLRVHSSLLQPLFHIVSGLRLWLQSHKLIGHRHESVLVFAPSLTEKSVLCRVVVWFRAVCDTGPDKWML